MSRGLLYLSLEGDHLFRVEGNGLRPVDPDTAFERLLVVADFVEEALIRAALPRMMGRDMSSLVERRLQAEFRETHYRCSTRLGPGKAEKTVDFLFQALPIAARLDAKLKPRLGARCAIESVVSVSMLVAHWAALAKVGAEPRLIILPTPAGIRHVFLDRGHAVLSRLTTAPVMNSEEAGVALGEELERTVQYLYNARMVERGSDIPTWVWGNEPACRGLYGQKVPGARFEPTPGDGKPADPGEEGYLALLQLLVRAPLPQQLAPDATRLHHFARQLRRGVMTAAVLGALALLGLGALLLIEAHDLSQQRDVALQSAAAIESNKAALIEQMAQANLDADTVRGTVATDQEQLSGIASLSDVMIKASRTFDLSPAFSLLELHWQISEPDDNSGMDLSLSGGACPEPWPISEEEGVAISDAPRAGLRLVGLVDPALSLRDAVAAREVFEASLRTQSGFLLRAESAPIDSSGQGVIRGGRSEDADPRAFDYCLSQQAPP